MDTIQQLRKELKTALDLNSAASVLHWDMETYMPNGGGDARAAQLALLMSLAHEHFIGEKVTEPLGELVDLDTGKITSGLDPESCRLVEEIWKDYHRKVALPKEFVEEMSKIASKGQQVWQEARKKNDFSLFAPILKKIIKLKHKEIEYMGAKDTPYDTLIDEFEPGMTVAKINVLFGHMKKALVPLVQKIGNSSVDTHQEILHQYYPEEKQWAFTKRVLADMGYDFNCGRQDKSAHPFSIGFHPTDVRITTRVNEHDFMYCLSSSIHEGGHALYEQALEPEWFGTPFAEAISYGVHESQSRLWENIVGLSKPFWEYYFPELQKVFPENLAAVSLDEFYLAINTIKPTLIRVSADEVTYSLHVMLRFEIEQLIINEEFPVADLPELWNQKMEEYLGVVPDTNAHGVLQDVHWSMGSFGYFPSYALGNLYNTMIFNKAKEELPTLNKDLRQGNLLGLREWLRKHVHAVGRKKTADELIKDISGEQLSAQPFLDYLQNKFSEIYGV